MYLHTCINSSFGHCIFAAKTYCNPIMERLDEILEIVREIREDIAYMKRHRNMLCGTPILEVSEVCDLLKISDRQLRRYRTSGQLVGFHFGRRLMFSTAEINRFIERVERVEELLLRLLLAGDELDIVYQQRVGVAVFFVKKLSFVCGD